MKKANKKDTTLDSLLGIMPYGLSIDDIELLSKSQCPFPVYLRCPDCRVTPCKTGGPVSEWARDVLRKYTVEEGR